MSDPVLTDTPWGYWPLVWSGADQSGNGNTLTPLAPHIATDNAFGGWVELRGRDGTKGPVRWDTGWTPTGDFTVQFIVGRETPSGATMLRGPIDADVDNLGVTFPGAGTSFYWPATPYDTPVMVTLSVVSGTLTWHWTDLGDTRVTTSGSVAFSASGGPLIVGQGYRAYCQVAVFDAGLSDWRAIVHASEQEVALPEAAAALATEQGTDGAQAVWALPTDTDTIEDTTGTLADATLTTGTGFTSAVPRTSGFPTTAGEWSAPVTVDTTAWSIEFVFRGTADTPTTGVTVTSGDIEITASRVFGSMTYAATVGSSGDNVTWTAGGPDSVDHLVAVTWSATGDLILYVDGLARATTAVTGTVTPAAAVAIESGHTSQAWSGLAVYDVELTAGQVASHAAHVIPPLLRDVVVDTFDRADGPIGNTSLLNEAWTVWSGTPVVASNEATGGSAHVQGIPGPRGVVASVAGGGTGQAVLGVVAMSTTDNDLRLWGCVADWGAGTVNTVTNWQPGDSLPSGTAVTLGATAEIRFQIDQAVHPDPITTEWYGSVWVDGALVIPLTLLPSMPADLSGTRVGFWVDGGASIVWLDALEGFSELGQPSTPQTGGLEFRFWPFDGVLLPFSQQGPQQGGLQPPPDPVRDARPVFLGAAPTVPQRGGIRVIWTHGTPTPPPPGEPPTWDGVGEPPADLQVNGYPQRTAATASPALNSAGSGSLTCTPASAPGLGDVLTFVSGGAAVFTGYADTVTTVVADQAEESGQLVTANAVDLLSIDWGETVVWPDFGASDPMRLGAPPQDDREFGWPMIGLLEPDQVAALTPSVANNPDLYGSDAEVLPLPSDFPDPTARWIWDTSPDNESQPQGWCFFRVEMGSWPGRYAIFLNAWDYARMYVDGAIVAEVTTPGQTVRFDVDFDWDYHLVAIAAYNEGGPAGVIATVMKHSTDGSGLLATGNGTGLDAPAMNTRGGWQTLGYPERTLRASTGKVLLRLLDEANRRGAPAGQWSASFTAEADSRGRAWPDDDNLVTLKTGQTYWDVLNMLAEDRIDFAASPAGRVLYAYNKGEGAGSVGIPWTVAVDAESLTTEVAGR